MKRKAFSSQTKSLNFENLCCRGQKHKWFYGKNSGEISSPPTIEQDDEANTEAPGSRGQEVHWGRDHPGLTPCLIATGQEHAGMGWADPA